MSVYRISNRFLDVYDPYWICRVLSLKIGTLTILMFLCNAFLKAPQGPMVYMLTTVAATAATEMLPVPSRVKKLGVYCLLLFLLSTSGMLIGLFSYLRVELFIVMMVFSYLALRFLTTNPKAAVVPSTMMIWGIINLEGGGATDLNQVLNSYLYFLEFGLTGVITVWFFPNFTPHIYKSALIRLLEADIEGLDNQRFRNSDPKVLSALYLLRSKLPFLPSQYQAFYEAIIRFQNEFVKPAVLSPDDRMLARALLSDLIKAINHEKPYSLVGEAAQQIERNNGSAYRAITNLVEGYNLCKA